MSTRLEALPGFQNPPAGYGIVPFFWWVGDPLTRERLGWILEQMEGMGVTGYQINYAHTDQGGRSCGLTIPSEPVLFTEAWWTLTGWFLREAKRQGAAISLSDYTLGLGQGWRMDEIIREHPEVVGQVVQMDQDGKVGIVKVPWSLDPMHPLSGRLYADKFFGEFDRRFPGEAGKGLNYFFSDELGFGVSGRIWTDRFAGEFKKRKGYDITAELPALFKDIGPRTPKIRLDYSDVMVALSEEAFFKPVFDWHQQRGMTMGCDHGGRGRDVLEFGDYFRTQRWNQGPGADQPRLGKDLIKAKVAASIAHLYERPRVWLEGFYGSGWGTTSADLVDATFANYVMGFNLLSLHGMYYSTHGGWWEWAPPDNTFRMPYWRHLRGFMDCVQRLSFLLSQGHHRCDVAILYPVAPMEAGMDGEEAVKTAFATSEQLYSRGVDFDFIDFESLDRARIVGKELHVAGEAYRVLVLPAMKAIRHSTLQKAVAFRRAGGVVVAVGALPEASDRIGREDPEVVAMAREVGLTDDLFAQLPGRDYEGPGQVQHRKIGPLDLYAIYGAPTDAEATFRVTGKVELWDPWTGTSRPLAVTSQDAAVTTLKLPLTEKEIQLIVFSPGQPGRAPLTTNNRQRTTLEITGDWEFELQPTSDNRFGDFHLPPTPARIGAEIRQLWYCEGEQADGPWRKVTCSFGPQFRVDGNLREFSWRWGIPNDPGHQGYHGLKGEMHDELLGVGQSRRGASHLPTVVEYSGGGATFETAVIAPHAMRAEALTGELKPSRVTLNGIIVEGTTLELKAGANPLTLEYDKPGRAYYVVATEAIPPAPAGALATRWWNHPAVMPFDVRSDERTPVGWYRFVAPPGLRVMTLNARGKVQAWVDGQPLTGLTLLTPAAKPVTVLLRIEQERGCYGGAAFPDPIRLDCGPGLISLGDWSENEGLLSYSGGAWYRKTVEIPEACWVMLDLGTVVSSVEVRVNGRLAGIKVAAPWKLDITAFVKPGKNRIEVLVCNTLANHFTSVPTGYRGDTRSGLLGPVTLEWE